MRVFLCEFVTGGGMRGEAMPASLAREGRLMRDALARDLSDLQGVLVTATYDDRLPPPPCPSVAIGPHDDAWAVWAAMAAAADFSWCVAPETGGVLADLTALCSRAGARPIGPDLTAIAIASSKSATGERLSARGVKTPPCWRPEAVPADAIGPFVSKPDDGAGCEATRVWPGPPPSGALPQDHIVQPWIAGEPASLTVLRAHGETSLLSANRQHVEIVDGALRFSGVTVGAYGDSSGALADLARDVSDALPGLSGIFGVDVVLSETGPMVIEINPRATTAYAGLREALGVNPAGLVEPFAPAAPRLAVAAAPVEVRP